MKNNASSILVVMLISLTLFGTTFTPVFSALKIDRTNYNPTMNGQILFAPMDSTETYLIDYNGTVIHQWSSEYIPGEAVYWAGNGAILRTIKTTVVGAGGSGGGLQKVLWNGTIAWDFRYDTNGNLSHHDVTLLPNGNVLMIAWETKSNAEAIAEGRDPKTLLGDSIWPSHIIEVQPTGPTKGTIVWEWHAWDHLIQDFDAAKANYGVVANHPELIDINYGYTPIISDWLHTNSIDYNAKFDQILLSIHSYNEIWVIDHSTTTAEAAGHTGGNSGKGGDLLYRWGNPEVYRAGTATDEQLFGQHDASWIKPGCPGEGDILVFNNGADRPGNKWSSVDEIVPPVNENGTYDLTSGDPYGPDSPLWRYIGDPPSSFYSGSFSGAERLRDGNTLICDGEHGRFFEVTPDGMTVWDYTNIYPSPLLNHVFKIAYIPQEAPPEPGLPDLDCSGALSWTDIAPGATVNGTFQIQNIGDNDSRLNWTIDTSSITWGTWTMTPQHGENLTPEEGPITVHVTVVAPEEKNTEFTGYIQVKNIDNPDDFDIISVSLKTPFNVQAHAPLWSILKQFFDRLTGWLSFLEKFFHPFQSLD